MNERAKERASERGGALGVRRGFVLLGCGVVVAVGVSAAMALWVPDDRVLWDLDIREGESPLEIVHWRGQKYSVEKVAWTASTQSLIAAPVHSDDPTEAWTFWYNGKPDPIPGSWPIHVDERDAIMNWSVMWMVWPGQMHEVRSGWPVAAMRSRRVTNWDDAKFTYVTQCDGLEIPASSLGERMRFTLEGNSLNSPYRPVPLVPVWPGFAVCSVFWAGVVGVVWYVPGAVRRAGRRRRGQCPTCAYELRGLHSCPECGTVSIAQVLAKGVVG